jgi:predicted O-methyltransferase YrrM
MTQMDDKIDAISRQMAGLENRMRRNLRFAADVNAAQESAAFMIENLAGARAHADRDDTLKQAVDSAGDGLFLEFGVASGRSLRLICRQNPRGRVVGFDTFKGLPDAWRVGFDRGTFAQESIPHVEGAELQIGLFQDTLEPFLASTSDQIAFMHLDADLYSSTKYVLDTCRSRLVPGAILLFDEYFNYPTWQEHEHKAFIEWSTANSIAWEYIAYTFAGEQVAVRIKSC